MSLLIAALLVAVVIVVGLYFFVPQVHTALLGVFKAGRDGLDKIVADGESLVARLEAHAKHQTTAATSHTVAADAHAVAADAATSNATTAAAAAAALKANIASVAVAPAVALTKAPKV